MSTSSNCNVVLGLQSSHVPAAQLQLQSARQLYLGGGNGAVNSQSSGCAESSFTEWFHQWLHTYPPTLLFRNCTSTPNTKEEKDLKKHSEVYHFIESKDLFLGMQASVAHWGVIVTGEDSWIEGPVEGPPFAPCLGKLHLMSPIHTLCRESPIWWFWIQSLSPMEQSALWKLSSAFQFVILF